MINRAHYIGFGLMAAVVLISMFIPIGWFISNVSGEEHSSVLITKDIHQKPFLDSAKASALPLFEPLRTPVRISTKAAVQVVRNDPFVGWRLSGVIQTSADTVIAWLQKQNVETRKIVVGDQFFGWEVQSIKQNQVIFIQEQQTKILEQEK